MKTKARDHVGLILMGVCWYGEKRAVENVVQGEH